MLKNVPPTIRSRRSPSGKAPVGNGYYDPGDLATALDNRRNDEGENLFIVMYELHVWAKPDRVSTFLGRMPCSRHKWNGMRAVRAWSATIWVERKEGVLARLGSVGVGKVCKRGKV